MKKIRENLPQPKFLPVAKERIGQSRFSVDTEKRFRPRLEKFPTGNFILRRPILSSRKNKNTHSGVFLGRLERIGLSIPVPQTGVLPLNYSRHVLHKLIVTWCALIYTRQMVGKSS